MQDLPVMVQVLKSQLSSGELFDLHLVGRIFKGLKIQNAMKGNHRNSISVNTPHFTYLVF